MKFQQTQLSSRGEGEKMITAGPLLCAKHCVKSCGWIISWHLCPKLWGNIRASLVAQTVKCLPTMWETWVRSLGWEDPLEKEMATYSSTLAWKTPWIKEPGRLQSMWSQRVGHDWATSLSLSWANIRPALWMKKLKLREVELLYEAEPTHKCKDYKNLKQS